MASTTTPATSAQGTLKSSDPLPTTVEGLTAEWFSKVLGKEVTSVAVGETLHGTASKILVEVKYADASVTLPTRLCVKGGFNPQLLALHPQLFAVYRLEAEFYHYIAPKVSMRLPPSYYNGIDTASGQGIVLLQDLKAADYKFGTPLEAWPVDRVRAGVEQLANLHAYTWGGKQEDFPWYSQEFSLRDVIANMMIPDLWQQRFFTDAKPPVPDELVNRDRIVAGFNALWNYTDPRLKCLVHGDPHIGNTFITPSGEPGFLDWQGIHINSAIHDVAYFVTGSLTIEDRRKNEEELFQHYLDELHKAGGPKFEKAEVWDEYRRQQLHGFAWALTGPMMQPKDLVDVMSERHAAAIVDHKSLELLGV